MTKKLYGSGIAQVEMENLSHKGERKGRGGLKAQYVICHGTASGTSYSARQTAYDFQNRDDGIGTHYVVGYDGEVVQCTDENDTAWGSGVVSGPTGHAPIGGGDPNASHDFWWNNIDCNAAGICIEHARSSDNMSPLSPIQKQASMYLVQDICTRWGIPLRYADETGGVTGHFSVNPVNRAYCPGPGFFHPDGTSDWFIPGAVAPTGVGSTGPGGPAGGSGGSGAETQSATSILDATFSTALALPENVHKTLVHTPGMAGLVESVDMAEQFQGIITVDTGNPVSDAAQSFGSTIVANFLPTLIRSMLVLLGLVMLVMILIRGIDAFL